MELDSRCEVVTSDKSHTTKRLYPETDYRKNSILNQAYFTVYTIKSALIFLLVDIYTMHRINTFSVIFRVSVKLSEVWSLIKDTKKADGLLRKKADDKNTQEEMFLRKISIEVTMHADMLREIIQKFFHSFFPWWLSNVAYFEFIAYSICINILRVHLPQKWDLKLWWITFCVLKFDNSHNKSKVL